MSVSKLNKCKVDSLISFGDVSQLRRRDRELGAGGTYAQT